MNKEVKASWMQLLKSLLSSLKSKIPKLRHKQVRAVIKKERRKLKRQTAARARDVNTSKDNDQSADEEAETAEDRIVTEHLQRESKRLHYLWLERERQAQEEFSKLKEEKKLRDEERRSLEEMTAPQEDSEDQDKEHGTDVAARKEEVCRDVISKLPKVPEGSCSGEWHNPMAPQNYIPGIVKEREPCTFFAKTGACRFGERCSRWHDRPASSCTILVHNMFSHFGLDQALRDEYDTDLTLEYEDIDTYQHFRDFYEDVLPEFKKFGHVVQFKVCCNHEPHLRGNVYVQYSSEQEASEAYRVFNGRWYASKQLTCEFCAVKQWKMAICGLFHSKRCPKGRTCNFLHVFRNPTNEFWAADRDLSESANMSTRPSWRNRRSPSGSSREHRHSKHRSRSRSPRSSPRRHHRSRSPSSRSVRHRRSVSRSPSYGRKSKRVRTKGRVHSERNWDQSRDSVRSRDGSEELCLQPDGAREEMSTGGSAREENKRRKSRHKNHRRKHRKRKHARSSSPSSPESDSSPAPLLDKTEDVSLRLLSKSPLESSQ